MAPCLWTQRFILDVLGWFLHVTVRVSVLRVRNCCFVLICASTTGKLQLSSWLLVPRQVLLLVPLLVLQFFFPSLLYYCVLLHPWMTNGMFPWNHSNSEVAVSNANVFFFNLFSLFLKGEELFLPIYSLCVCVNTFILNLKLIKYHFSQMSPAVWYFISKPVNLTNVPFLVQKKPRLINHWKKSFTFYIY